MMMQKGGAKKQHLRPEDHKVVLIKSWYNRLQNQYYKGKVPTCKRCGKELQIGQRIHRAGHKSNYYHEECWWELFF